MAKLAKTAWDAFVNANVNTNGNQEITGAIMNQALIDLSDSILWGDYRIVKSVSISQVGQFVSFGTPLVNANYTLVVRVYDAAGEAVGYTIDPATMTVSGFWILPAVDGNMDYIVITHV